MLMPSCGTSRGSGRIWCTAPRSAVDPKRRVIVAVQAEPATGHEGDALVDLVRRARWAGHAVSELAADQGYAAARHL